MIKMCYGLFKIWKCFFLFILYLYYYYYITIIILESKKKVEKKGGVGGVYPQDSIKKSTAVKRDLISL